MMKRFDLYGSKSLSPGEAARRLAVVLEMRVEARDSDYRGGEYYLGTGDAAEKLTVQANFEDEDGYLAEPGFPSHTTLVYVTGANDVTDGRLRSVDGLSLLRTEVL